MSTTFTIAKREFRSSFDSPLAYVVICLGLVMLGIFFFFVNDFWQGDSAFNATPVWTQLTQPDLTKAKLQKGYTRHLEDVVYFPKTGQTFDSVSGVYSIVFYPDGRVKMPGTSTTASVVIKTDQKVSKPQFTIDISPSGRVYAH